MTRYRGDMTVHQREGQVLEAAGFTAVSAGEGGAYRY